MKRLLACVAFLVCSFGLMGDVRGQKDAEKPVVFYLAKGNHFSGKKKLKDWQQGAVVQVVIKDLEDPISKTPYHEGKLVNVKAGEGDAPKAGTKTYTYYGEFTEPPSNNLRIIRVSFPHPVKAGTEFNRVKIVSSFVADDVLPDGKGGTLKVDFFAVEATPGKK